LRSLERIGLPAYDFILGAAKNLGNVLAVNGFRMRNLPALREKTFFDMITVYAFGHFKSCAKVFKMSRLSYVTASFAISA
jgi:hypothetical protein